MSLHKRILESLRNDIASQKYPVGSFMPPERELSELLCVSRSTMRKALDVLSSEGIFERRQGSGSWVCHSPFNRDVHLPSPVPQGRPLEEFRQTSSVTVICCQ